MADSEFELRTFDDPSAYQDAVGAYLSREEARNCLMLGIISSLRAKSFVAGASGEPPLLAALYRAGECVGAAIRTPPHNLTISPLDPGAARFLAAALKGRCEDLSGIAADPATAGAFAGSFLSEFGIKFYPIMEMKIYELERLIPPPKCPGHFSFATPTDAPETAPLAAAFIRETGIAHYDALKLVESYIAERRLAVWRDGDLAGIAGFSGKTPTGTRVNLVYTPPEKRGRGYASNLVAGLSHWLLRNGLKRCFLFADKANPTSNGIYRKLGYVPVAEFMELRAAGKDRPTGRT